MLELEKEERKEAQELLEKQQQHNRLQYAGLKQEIAFLQCENRSLQYVLFCVCF
jgi:hypothetical protein